MRFEVVDPRGYGDLVMANEQETVNQRRQKTWADLAFLERAIERSGHILGTVPGHWQRARALLWRDLRALVGHGQRADR